MAARSNSHLSYRQRQQRQAMAKVAGGAVVAVGAVAAVMLLRGVAPEAPLPVVQEAASEPASGIISGQYSDEYSAESVAHTLKAGLDPSEQGWRPPPPGPAPDWLVRGEFESVPRPEDEAARTDFEMHAPVMGLVPINPLPTAKDVGIPIPVLGGPFPTFLLPGDRLWPGEVVVAPSLFEPIPAVEDEKVSSDPLPDPE